jgi:glucose/arabinose dehydrogenase
MSSHPVVLARPVVIACLALVACSGAQSGTERSGYTFSPLASGLSSPVHVAAAPGLPSRLYVVEQAGRIRIVEGGKVTGTLLDIHGLVRSGGEQGMLSVAFHPSFAANRRFYVDYTDTGGNTRVVEYRANDDATQAVAGSARRLLLVRQPYSNHNGGQLQFDRQGLLYVGMGDGGSAGDPGDRAQNLSVRLGKLFRIDPLRAAARWRIVGYGLRNPWRFSFDRVTGDLWIGDVGQGSWEEIDHRARARIGTLANYGWNRYEGRSVYDRANPLRKRGTLLFPVWVYPHSNGACSVTGGYVYRGSATPAARGRYFFGDYCNGHVWSFRAGAGRTSAVMTEPFSIPALSSFGEDGAGELYATSLNGTVYALRA